MCCVGVLQRPSKKVASYHGNTKPLSSFLEKKAMQRKDEESLKVTHEQGCHLLEKDIKYIPE